MKRPISLCALACACSAPVAPPPRAPSPDPSSPVPAVAADDGTYLDRIDPLGGQWRLQRLGSEDFAPFEAWVSFTSGGFLNHGAGCGGGYPAFYRLDGRRVTLTRIEAIRTGHCQDFNGPNRTAALDSERRLAAFLDGLQTWSRPDDRTLVLLGQGGVEAILTAPIEPNPDLAGRWRIETIGGEPLVTERRPPTLSFAMAGVGAYADCNSFGATYSVPSSGRLQVEGPVVSTAIGCPPEDAAEDEAMARAITGATGYRVEADRLTLTGGPGLVARRYPEPDRRLPGEYEACGNTLLGAYHEGPVTLDFRADTVTDQSGCRAAYTADGPNLTLRLDRQTCSGEQTPFIPGQPDSVGGDISLLATAPPDAFAFDSEGRLVLRTPRGLLGMCRKGDPPPFGS
ncbi:META domain-containing protein [Brevundimonas sp.]|uniref:META domain-containing protein n=1 Tax=Brevundimonas sp. TaxID=1871086 RepID=UPI0025E973B9|nr:META domain-containing protein [Brevundimonas sp.]